MPELGLTVLGASPAWANAGGSCSGYLVSNGPDKVLIDCGFGTLSRLREMISLDELRAIVISHLHADHFMDLVPLRYALKYGALRADPNLALFAPPGAREFFSGLGQALDGSPDFFEDTYELSEYNPHAVLSLGSLAFSFAKVKHYIPSYAMAIQSGRKLVYSSDAAPCETLVNLAADADLFLCESAIDSPSEDDPDPAYRGHMTASEAAEIAQQAKVRQLLLTHHRANPDRDPGLLDEVNAIFSGPAEFAQERRTYSV